MRNVPAKSDGRSKSPAETIGEQREALPITTTKIEVHFSSYWFDEGFDALDDRDFHADVVIDGSQPDGFTATVVAQGVVRANRTQLQALVFLNQIVTRVRAGEPETVLTPYKVLVTMVHTDKGWLVSNLETDAPQDKTN